jgi:hypothetical protein
MSRATFGDFLHAAHWDLGPPAGLGGPYAVRGNVEEVSRSLLRVVIVMNRYVQDLTVAFAEMPTRTRPALSPWARACIQAREALSNAAGFLIEPHGRSRWPASQAASPLARRLDAVTVSLTTGRDLLQTHFTPGTGSTRQHRSEWALIITSEPVTRALLTEIASLSQRIARQGADLALSPLAGAPADRQARHKLNAACQWLWALNTSVQAARRREPVAIADRELLAAIPVNTLPGRRAPGVGAPVGALCQAAISSAERIRHLAWASVRQAPWSPGMTATSLRQVALTSTVTSHNCEILLHTLAARTRQIGLAQISADLSAAADVAERARSTWLHVARQVGQITTETRGQLSPAAAEASDLALWTGRLAYADPRWTPASGPAHPARPPESLAAGQQDVPAAVATVHQACETLALLSQTERDQISASAQAGRILVPTSSLPDDTTFPVPSPGPHVPASTSCWPPTPTLPKPAVRPRPPSGKPRSLSGRPARYSLPRGRPSTRPGLPHPAGLWISSPIQRFPANLSIWPVPLRTPSAGSASPTPACSPAQPTSTKQASASSSTLQPTPNRRAIGQKPAS